MKCDDCEHNRLFPYGQYPDIQEEAQCGKRHWFGNPEASIEYQFSLLISSFYEPYKDCPDYEKEEKNKPKWELE